MKCMSVQLTLSQLVWNCRKYLLLSELGGGKGGGVTFIFLFIYCVYLLCLWLGPYPKGQGCNYSYFMITTAEIKLVKCTHTFV